MTAKERINNALEGKTVDRMPVTVLYNQLYFRDHFTELTGKDLIELYRWLYSEPEEHFKTYKGLMEKAPFEILQPQASLDSETRENTEFVRKGAEIFRHNKRENTFEILKSTGKHTAEYKANEEQKVFDKEDVKNIRVVQAGEMAGGYEYAKIIVQNFGRTYFILTSGLTGILWNCHSYLGQTNTLSMLIENPSLVDYLSKKLLEQNIERIRAACSAGGDAIFIDDAMAYSDIISKRHYERFVLPYTRQMVSEIHRLNHKAILIYFGGVMDRLDLIAETGADGLSCETSMKGYTNDINQITETIGNRMTLFGNIDPIGILQNGTDEQLENEINRQAEASRKARGFIMCTGSPVTPDTDISRVQKFIELSKKAGKLCIH